MEQLCDYCGYYGEMVYVHSHYQCPRCKNIIAPCCEGEHLGDPGQKEEGEDEVDDKKENTSKKK